MLIPLLSFRSERPKVDARELGITEAQVARNCKLWSGKLRPWFRPLLKKAAVKTGPIKAIYRYTDSEYWLHWDKDVDVARSPIADANTRIYYTGDGAPKMTDLKAATGQRTIALDAQATDTLIRVDRVRGLRVGDTVRVQLNSGTQDVTITAITDTFGMQRISVTPALSGAADEGNSITNLAEDYPLDAYPMGVPAPSAAPELNVFGTKGTITDVSGELETASVSDSSGEVDLPALTDVNGSKIQLRAKVKIAMTIRASQHKLIILQIDRIDTPTDQTVFRQEYPVTIQGETVVHPFTGEPLTHVAQNWEWEREIEAVDAPAEGDDPVYRLYVFASQLVGDTPTIDSTLSARYNDQLNLTLAAGEGALLSVGDRINVKSVVGDQTLEPVNDTHEIEAISGDVVSIQSSAYGAYTSGGEWELLHNSDELESRAYVYTFVASVAGKEMEGPPCPVTEIITVGDGDRVTVGHLNTIEDPWALGDKHFYTAKRIYRTAVGNETDPEFLFVAEIPANGVSYTDTVRGKDLGEVLPSALWDGPPDDMTGIIELPNGVMAAYRENQLLLAVPNQPHAWPVTYRQSVHDAIEGIAAYGASIVVGSKGRPQLATGVEPSAIAMEDVELTHPNLSKRGMVDMGYGVLYPTLTGLVMFSQGQSRIVTSELFDDDQWAALNPASFVAAKYNERYICFYDNGEEKAGFILDPHDPRATLSFIDFHSTEVWSDPRTGEVFFVYVNQDDEEEIVQWDADKGNIPLRYRWRSKEFVNRTPAAVSVVKVDAEHYPVRVHLYADGQHYDSVTVYDSKPARVTTELGEFRKWEVEVVGDTEVEAVIAASTIGELVRYQSGIA